MRLWKMIDSCNICSRVDAAAGRGDNVSADGSCGSVQPSSTSTRSCNPDYAAAPDAVLSAASDASHGGPSGDRPKEGRKQGKLQT